MTVHKDSSAEYRPNRYWPANRPSVVPTSANRPSSPAFQRHRIANLSPRLLPFSTIRMNVLAEIAADRVLTVIIRASSSFRKAFEEHKFPIDARACPFVRMPRNRGFSQGDGSRLAWSFDYHYAETKRPSMLALKDSQRDIAPEIDMLLQHNSIKSIL